MKNCVLKQIVEPGGKGVDHIQSNWLQCTVQNISQLFPCFCMFLLYGTDDALTAYCHKNAGKD